MGLTRCFGVEGVGEVRNADWVLLRWVVAVLQIPENGGFVFHCLINFSNADVKKQKEEKRALMLHIQNGQLGQN